MITTTITTTTTASTSSLPTSSQCYECSGEGCGKEGSATANNCPSCMVYRNPNDQSNFFYETRLDYFENKMVK